MWIPFRTLFWKEVHRFWKVGLHTILAPVLTGFLSRLSAKITLSLLERL